MAQSMGGILAVRLALERPDRVASLVLVATSGGMDLRRFGAADWRPDYLNELPGAPRWFVEHRTDVTDHLAEIVAPTLLVWSDSDPVSPLAVSHYLAECIPRAREVTVSGGSHAFANERPDEVAALIREFVLGLGKPQAPQASVLQHRTASLIGAFTARGISFTPHTLNRWTCRPSRGKHSFRGFISFAVSAPRSS